MKLMTKAIEKKIPALYSTDGQDSLCPLKFFGGSSWSWFVKEGEKQADGDWLFFGKVVSSLCPEGELGYFTLSELKSVKFKPFNLGIERDMWWTPIPISQCK